VSRWVATEELSDADRAWCDGCDAHFVCARCGRLTHTFTFGSEVTPRNAAAMRRAVFGDPPRCSGCRRRLVAV
jgi:hypothetical protein